MSLKSERSGFTAVWLNNSFFVNNKIVRTSAHRVEI